MVLFCSNVTMSLDCLCTQMEKISSGYETMSENWSCLSTCFSVDHCIHVRFSLEKKTW